MQRNFARQLITQFGKARNLNGIERHSIRAYATVKDVFQNKSEFPTRHIGPRKTDVVSMLDLLGFKVIWYQKERNIFNYFIFLDTRRTYGQSCSKKDQIRSRFTNRRAIA